MSTIIKDAGKHWREVDFYLRLHRHLPDGICGRTIFGPCFYRGDGEPINGLNDYVEKLPTLNKVAKSRAK